jgi:hypothetical protein
VGTSLFFLAISFELVGFPLERLEDPMYLAAFGS